MIERDSLRPAPRAPSDVAPASGEEAVADGPAEASVDTSGNDEANEPERPVEIGGQKGPEPTRYGDWEGRGRCTDF